MRLVQIVLRVAVGLAAAGALALAGLLFFMWWRHGQPVTLPAPGGRYAVGRVEYDWVDATRAETFGPGRDGHRELDVWIWYPAAPNSTNMAPAHYLPPAWRAARAQTQQPAFLTQLLIQDTSVVTAHAVLGLPLSPAQAAWPVVVFQPGLGPILPDYTTLAEDLASRGYVVVGSTPTYSSAVAVFPDGRVVEGNLANLLANLYLGAGSIEMNALSIDQPLSLNHQTSCNFAKLQLIAERGRLLFVIPLALDAGNPGFSRFALPNPFARSTTIEDDRIEIRRRRFQ